MTETPAIPILVVDDEPLIREMSSAALEEGGFNVLQAESAEEARGILEAKVSELGGVATDVNLGKDQPTGWEIARIARELNPQMPIVYMTGASANEWPSRGVPNSVLLEKPFASADIVVALASLRKID